MQDVVFVDGEYSGKVLLIDAENTSYIELEDSCGRKIRYLINLFHYNDRAYWIGHSRQELDIPNILCHIQNVVLGSVTNKGA